MTSNRSLAFWCAMTDDGFVLTCTQSYTQTIQNLRDFNTKHQYKCRSIVRLKVEIDPFFGYSELSVCFEIDVTVSMCEKNEKTFHSQALVAFMHLRLVVFFSAALCIVKFEIKFANSIWYYLELNFFF